MSNLNPVIENDIKKISRNLTGVYQLLEGKTLLITGGSGFLGKYLINTILYLNENRLNKPCKIISLDNHITSTETSVKEKNLTQINHDVKQPLSTKSKIDYIIHAAGIASPVYYQKFPLETIDAAVNGTRNMLELARKKKIQSFLYFSSSEIYGDPPADQIPTKETFKGYVSCFGPRSCYDESKRLGETLCYVYKTRFNVPIKIVRPFNVFGPGMAPFDHRVIPSFLYSAFTGEPLQVHSSGNQTRTFCYISDATTAFLLVLLIGSSGEAYNVGNNKNEINMNQLANSLNQIFKNKIQINNVEYPKNYPADEPQRRCPDLTKIKKQVGYKANVNLKQGLQKTVKWCKSNWF